MGPVDYVLVEFPGNNFKGDIVPALAELTHNGTIRIIDLLFVRKDEEGSVTWQELDDLPREQGGAFDDVDGDIADLLNEEDVEIAAKLLNPHCSAAVVVYENVWAAKLWDAIDNAGGRLVDHARIPDDVVDAALAAADQGTE
jgi:hypothetical protein